MKVEATVRLSDLFITSPFDMAIFALCDMIITDADVVNSSHLDAVS